MSDSQFMERAQEVRDATSRFFMERMAEVSDDGRNITGGMIEATLRGGAASLANLAFYCDQIMGVDPSAREVVLRQFGMSYDLARDMAADEAQQRIELPTSPEPAAAVGPLPEAEPGTPYHSRAVTFCDEMLELITGRAFADGAATVDADNMNALLVGTIGAVAIIAAQARGHDDNGEELRAMLHQQLDQAFYDAARKCVAGQA